jgi:hypothetical protein
MFGEDLIRSNRYCESVVLRDAIRTTMVTVLVTRAKCMAACPAELPPPTTPSCWLCRRRIPTALSFIRLRSSSRRASSLVSLLRSVRKNKLTFTTVRRRARRRSPRSILGAARASGQPLKLNILSPALAGGLRIGYQRAPPKARACIVSRWMRIFSGRGEVMPSRRIL